MRKYWSIIMLVLVSSCSEGEFIEHETEVNNETMNWKNRSVAFYNVENLFDTKDDHRTRDNDFTPNGDYLWDEERYEKKLKMLSEAIGLIDVRPAIMGLAEVENHHVVEDLLETDAFRDLNMGFVHYDSPDQRGIDVSLLYDKDLFEVEHSEKIPVKLANNPNFKTRDILYVHGFFSGNVEAHVFVNHWSSRREGQYETEHKRIRAASILRNRIEEIMEKDEDANIIVMGDFNDTPVDKSVDDVLEASEYGDHDEDDLINLYVDDQEDDLGTSVHRGDWNVLDQIIVSQSIYKGNTPLKIKDKDGYIARKQQLLYTYHNGDQKPNATYGGRKYFGGYSDHLPVYIIIE